MEEYGFVKKTLCMLMLCAVYRWDCATVFQDYATDDNVR